MQSELIDDIVLLYVEDDEDVRLIYERFLKRRLLNVLTAANGKEGYDLYLKEKPDIIITDVQMPVMDGLEMCSLIRDDNKDIPIIITSAHSETHLFQEAINISINMFLIKPIDMTQLFNTVKITAENVVLKQKSKKNQELITKKTFQLEQTNQKLKKTISNLKEVQSKLIESEHLASLGVLSAGIAHEINTPIGIGLTGITHLTDITKDIKRNYQKQDISQEEFEEYLNNIDDVAKMIYSNIVRTSQIVGGFKQVAVDQTSEIKRIFNVYEYMQEILLSINNLTKKTNLKVNINIDKTLKINSYPGSLAQIITNFIINSIMHGYDKEGKGIICIDIVKVGNTLELTYKDDGKGISKNNLPKIFELFFTTSSKKGGTGLGLHIVHNIVTTNLNGTIECSSEKEKGIVFNIKFPLDK